MDSTPKSRTPTDVIIVGGGIIGTALACELAGRGLRVLLLERGSIAGEGSAASAAAAGMLTPQAEADEPSAFFDFGLANRAIYADWVRAVSAEAELPIEYRTLPVLLIATDESQAALLRAKAAWQAARGLRTEWLSAAEAQEREPILAPDLAGALLLPAEAVVDSKGLTIALAAAARKRGARIVDGTTATELILAGGPEGDRAVGVVAGGTAHRAATVVIAAGAWGSAISRLPIPADWIQPRRGQILVVRPAAPAGFVGPAMQPLRHVLYTHGAYAVPRANGDLVLGTTVEDAGFRPVVTAAGLAGIVGGVTRFAPGLAGAEVIRTAVGLRPAARDGLPAIGLMARMPGLALAIGHFRNGILLAPLTARLLADAIVTGQHPAELAPFSPDRLPPAGTPTGTRPTPDARAASGARSAAH
jgi:glycine oxidase